MKSQFFQPTGSGSLGEPRRPRTLEEFPRYNNEESIQRGAKLTILVAEGDDDSRLMMRTLLEMKGYRALGARGGEEAMDVALLEQLDLILLDLELAGLDGLKVIYELRRKDKTREVPIVIISGWDPGEHKDAALAAGCNEYLLKPIDFEVLEAILSRYVPLRSAK